ncbi:MAG: septum formation initiator family protein [Candidatus Babeliales bacterium]
MNILHKAWIKIFFGIEVLAIIFLYLFGSQGLPLLLRLRKENFMLEAQIDVLAQEVAVLETSLHEWHRYAFYKEKIAREQLQLAHEQEQIFYLTTHNEGREHEL